jgi:streptogramin lyase
MRVGPAGDLWITDNGANTVTRFSPDGEVLATLSEANEKLKSSDDLVIASNRDLFMADTGNGRIIHVTPDGKFPFTVRSQGERAGAVHHRLWLGDRREE